MFELFIFPSCTYVPVGWKTNETIEEITEAEMANEKKDWFIHIRKSVSSKYVSDSFPEYVDIQK